MDVLKKVPVREQAPDVRNKNFEEVCLGYNMEEAQEEATRCINCKNAQCINCLLYTSPSPRDVEESRMPSSA